MIEVVVALAVFFLIIDVAISMFISVVSHQKRILQEQELLNQTSYAAEYITRALRSAIKDVAGSCLQGNAGSMYRLTHFNASSGFYEGVKFIRSDGVCQEFFVDTDRIFKETKDGASAQNIISDKFFLQYARFVINGDKEIQGASQSDTVQPRLTFLINIKNQQSAYQQEHVIQTTVSQRNLNISN